MIIMPINSWSAYKATTLASKALLLQYTESANSYDIFAAENMFVWNISLSKDGGSDVVDFETNFKAGCNKPITEKDSDGSALARVKAAPIGWTFQLRGFEFTTSALASVINKDSSGSNLTDVSIKLYNISDVEITVPGIANANLLTCVKTVIDIEPPYDYYVIGAKIRVLSALNSDVVVNAIIAPDIAAGSGGSKVLAQNVNLRYIAAGDKFDADGRAAKLLPYSASVHTNKIRLIISHPAGAQHNFSLNLEHFKV